MTSLLSSYIVLVLTSASCLPWRIRLIILNIPWKHYRINNSRLIIVCKLVAKRQGRKREISNCIASADNLFKDNVLHVCRTVVSTNNHFEIKCVL